MPAVTRSQMKLAKALDDPSKEYRPNVIFIRNHIVETGLKAFDLSKTDDENAFKYNLRLMLEFVKSLKRANQVKFLKGLFEYININVSLFDQESVSWVRLSLSILEKTFEFDEIQIKDELYDEDFKELRRIYLITRKNMLNLIKKQINITQVTA
jgi:hypothetical protein